MMRSLKNIYKVIAAVILLICTPKMAEAQEWAVSTNVLSWLNLGTINAEGSYKVNDHVSVNAALAINPWQINTPTFVTLRNRQYGGHMGARYWPWHTFSEWWIGAKVQYKNFEQVGLLSSNLMRGDALGAGLSAGYSMMIAENVNLDFGLGFWGGRLLSYVEYNDNIANPSKIRTEGPRNFIFLDSISVSVAYIF